MTASTVVFNPTFLERVRYYPRQLITVEEMRIAQEYEREKWRRHNRYLHGWGVVCGCQVIADPETEYPWRIKISGGCVITPRGDQIMIPDGLAFDLAGDWIQTYDPCAQVSPCPPTSQMVSKSETKTVYLAACYAECDTRPVRIHPSGCGCDDTACEYSRIREGFELVRLDELPDSYKEADENNMKWANWADSDPSITALPACSTSDDDCVVLASITLPDSKNTNIIQDNIKYDKRRVLFSLPALLAKFQASQTPQISSTDTTHGAMPGTTPSPMPTPPPDSAVIRIIDRDWRFYNPDFDPGGPVEFVLDPTSVERISESEAVLGAKVILKDPAPAEGVKVRLSKIVSNPMAVSLPANVLVQPGQTQASFQIRVRPSLVAASRRIPFESNIVATIGAESTMATLKANFHP